MRNIGLILAMLAVSFILVPGNDYAAAAEAGHQVGLQRDCGSEFRDRDFNRDQTLTYEEFESGRFALGAPAGLGPDISGRGFASPERSPNSRMSEQEFCALFGGDSDTAG